MLNLNNTVKSITAILIAIFSFFGIAIILGVVSAISVKIIYIILILLISGFFIYIIYNIPKPFQDLKGAAYLAPWYFNDDTPGILKNHQKLRWRFIEKISEEYVGVIVLEDQNQNCFAILRTYSYILPFADSTKFLIWNRELKKNIPKELRIFQFNADDLTIIDNPEKKILELNNQEAAFWISATPASILAFSINPRDEIHQLQFPDCFKSLDEFIIIADLENLYENPENGWNNTTLIVFQPKQGRFFIYPQDWFNKSEYDFGYQWITRAARDPKKGYIQGQGIRIKDFILDDTNRKIRKHLTL